MTGQHPTVPRRFALVRYSDGDDSRMIVAWGIELPDGSTVSASIDDQTVAVCSRAAHCELIHGAELVWIHGEIDDFEKERSS
ncbi:hypothetical protein [Micromonospora sp. WMMA1947]|uniref:hypothetical protein n=1 Tax=Micromonospora sp. WMMA1947 TaxID=3015163 RepID=UPI00248C0C04|nr:hypothetical protein [Micromonospora sp. WMMA1947]WBC08873.1 hypothetical protein O7604_27210 [Micromonospora sp. WMMA1947]